MVDIFLKSSSFFSSSIFYVKRCLLSVDIFYTWCSWLKFWSHVVTCWCIKIIIIGGLSNFQSNFIFWMPKKWQKERKKREEKQCHCFIYVCCSSRTDFLCLITEHNGIVWWNLHLTVLKWYENESWREPLVTRTSHINNNATEYRW